MTYEEFKKQIKLLNIAYEKQFEIFNNGNSITVRDSDWHYATIRTHMSYSLSVSSLAFENLETNLRHDLLKAVYEFAQTPINSRKLQQMYRLSLRLIPNSDFKYLCKRCGSVDELEFDVESNTDSKFMQEEIDEIKEKYSTDLKDFEIIEVEE